MTIKTLIAAICCLLNSATFAQQQNSVHLKSVFHLNTISAARYQNPHANWWLNENQSDLPDQQSIQQRNSQTSNNRRRNRRDVQFKDELQSDTESDDEPHQQQHQWSTNRPRTTQKQRNAMIKRKEKQLQSYMTSNHASAPTIYHQPFQHPHDSNRQIKQSQPHSIPITTGRAPDFAIGFAQITKQHKLMKQQQQQPETNIVRQTSRVDFSLIAWLWM
jgi:hypothetical protein